MIQYNTHDIIAKAKQLADIVNSDFISYSEDVTLLNDAYEKLYQQSIDTGDNLYVKSYKISSLNSCTGDYVEYDLPEDFYQLRSIKYVTIGFEAEPLPRKVKDGYAHTPSYEIKNNKLVVYGRLHSNIYLDYYPIPYTLTLENKDISLKSYEGKPVAYYRNMLITHDETNKCLIAYDLNTSEMINSWSLATSEETYIFDHVDAGVNGIVAYFMLNNLDHTLVANYDEEGTIEAACGKITVRADDGVFLEEPTEENIISMLVDEDDTYTIVRHDDSKEFINDDIELVGSNNTINLLEDDKLFITNDNGEMTIYEPATDDLYFVGNRMNKVICAGSYDLSSGYGYLVYRPGRGYFITSCFEDTNLDYPNNIYYTLLSYLLAISYKTKQNADISALGTTYEETLNQYYDMIRRDTNGCVRINNIYK